MGNLSTCLNAPPALCIMRASQYCMLKFEQMCAHTRLGSVISQPQDSFSTNARDRVALFGASTPSCAGVYSGVLSD
jgi:hypothetical protein